VAKDKQTDVSEPRKTAARLCSQDDRAADGLTRFKLRLDGHPSGARVQQYVLAPDRVAAEEMYLASLGVPRADVKDAVKLVVAELPD